MTNAKMTKFHTNDFGAIKIRSEILPNGKVIAFGVALTDLTTMHSGNHHVDFDKESDRVLKRFYKSKSNMAFQYTPHIGFIEVDINIQRWFIFSSQANSENLIQNTDIQKIADEGAKIYARIKVHYDPKEKGRFLAIDIESKKAYVGNTSAEALELARSKHPNKVFYVVKIGFDVAETMAKSFIVHHKK